MFWKNKTVWITGASSGIGKELAIQLSAKNAKLILSGRNIGSLEEVKALCDQPDSIKLLTLDLEQSDVLDDKAQEAIASFGQVDVLINNAGVSQRSKAKETNEAVFNKIMAINFYGTLKLSQAILPHFTARNEGHFVTLSSVAGFAGLPYRTAYCASKHALEGYFASLRTELWKTNINILIVRPGAVNTNIAKNSLTEKGEKFNSSDKVIDNGQSPAYVAKTIINGIENEKRVLFIGALKEKIFYFINRYYPRLGFHLVKNLEA